MAAAVAAAAAAAGVIAEVSKRPSRERDTAQQTKFSRGTGDNSNSHGGFAQQVIPQRCYA